MLTTNQYQINGLTVRIVTALGKYGFVVVDSGTTSGLMYGSKLSAENAAVAKIASDFYARKNG